MKNHGEFQAGRHIFKFVFLKYYFAYPVEWLLLKKSSTCWKGCGEAEILVYCWWERETLQLLWKTVWQFLKILKIVLPYDLAVPLLCIYLIESKALSQRDIFTPNSSPGVEATLHVHWWMNKETKCCPYIQCNIIQCWKWRKSWCMLHCG